MNRLLSNMALGVAAVGLVFWCYAQTESYCFFAPAVDTKFASGFSEASFARVQPGLPESEVRDRLGSPLFTTTDGEGHQLWWYSKDGKFRWGDWAWLGRCVEFDAGVVRRTVSCVIYD
jgi:hypothetical protein